MQDFQASALEHEKNTRTTQIRHGDGLARLITEASNALGVEKSTFLRAIIEREASRILQTRSHHTLSAEDLARFAAALDTPPPPTPRALAARQAYAQRVEHAD